MKQIKSNKVLFSVFQKNRPHLVNLDIHRTIINSLYDKNISLLEVNKKCKNFEEMSILLQTIQQDEFEKLKSIALEIATQFNQETILLIHNDDTCELFNIKSNSLTKIGTFTEVDNKTRLLLDEYNEINGRYFTVK